MSKYLGTMRLQLFVLIMGFLLLGSAVSFGITYQFFLKDKESSLRELQNMRVEHLRGQLERRLNELRSDVSQAAWQLQDGPEARPSLDPEAWQYLVAGSAVWTAPGTVSGLVPTSIEATSEPLVVLSADQQWVVWSQLVDPVGKATGRPLAVQAKFRASLLFRPVAEFPAGGPDVVVVHRPQAKSYTLLWGDPASLERLQKVDDVDATLLSSSMTLANRDLPLPGDRLYVSWSPVKGTPWLVVSTATQSTLVTGLRFLLTSLGFWIAFMVLLAMVVSVWFARRWDGSRQQRQAHSNLNQSRLPSAEVKELPL